MNKPLVSISCITYNQKEFIEQALDSFLMQKTDFPYEILIGDDYSTDGTREIVVNYQKKFPDKIRLISSDKNVGRVENILKVFDSVLGKYIAICEGDDYWTDPLKLQKQVDFMESNEKFSTCAHQTLTKYDFQVEEETQFYIGKTNKNILTVRDFLDKIPFHTSSILFRKSLLNLSPLIQYPALVRDHPLMIILSTFGPIKLLPDIMSVYRKNKKGVSENMSFSMIYEANIETADALNKVLPHFRLKSYYIKGLWSRYYLQRENDLDFFHRTLLFFRYAISSFYIFPKNLKSLFFMIKHSFNGN
jgi:glycosyltransferase involved in cell wall biosynthesis